MKKMRKMLLAMTLVLSMSLLNACNFNNLFSKTPTAEELLNQTWDETGYIDADVIFDIGLSMDMGALMGETGDTSTKMNMDVAMDVNVKGTETVQHMAGNISMNLFGMDIEMPYETYSVTLNDVVTVYDYDSDYKQWTVEETSMDNGSTFDASKFTSINADIFESYELAEVNKEDTVYTVTGVIDFGKLMTEIGTDGEEILGDVLTTDEFDLSTLKMDVTVLFDKETLKPISYEMLLDPETFDAGTDEGEITKLNMVIKINEICADKTIEVPQSVIDSAIPVADLGYDYDYNIDSEFTFDDSDVIYEDVIVESETEVTESDIDSDVEVVIDPSKLGSIDAFTNYQFTVNGTTLSLPCTYDEIVAATGWEMKSSESKSWLEGGYYTSVSLRNENDDTMCTIDIYNNTDEDLIYTDCKVTEIYQTEWAITEKDAVAIVFPGNLKAGDENITLEKLVALFGEPARTYTNDEYEGYVYEEYTFSEDESWTTRNCIKVYLVNGIIDNISMDHIGW